MPSNNLDFLINMAIQLPLVAAFMWFVIRLQSDQNASNEKRDNEWRDWLEKRDEESKRSNDRVVATIDKFRSQLETLTHVNLLLYSEIKSDDGDDKQSEIIEVLTTLGKLDKTND